MINAFDRKVSHTPARATILISAAVASVLLLALLYLAAVAPRGMPLLPYYYVNAQFRNVENLRILSTVQIAGRRVGQVSDITYDNGLADVKLQMLPGTQQLTAGATARIRVKNPIGAKYVEITPSASGGALHSGATLPASHTSTSVDTQALLSGFNAPTRRNLTASLIGLGQGFIGRGQEINGTLATASPCAEQPRRASPPRSWRGPARPRAWCPRPTLWPRRMTRFAPSSAGASSRRRRCCRTSPTGRPACRPPWTSRRARCRRCVRAWRKRSRCSSRPQGSRARRSR